MKNRRFTNSRGMTLVEVMVASLIALLVSLALLGAQVSARHLTRKARLHMEATSIAQSILEQQKTLAFNALGVNNLPANNVVISDNGTAGDATDDINGVVAYNVVDNGTTKSLSVTVTWTHLYFGVNQVSNLTLSTVVADV